MHTDSVDVSFSNSITVFTLFLSQNESHIFSSNMTTMCSVSVDLNLFDLSSSKVWGQ